MIEVAITDQRTASAILATLHYYAIFSYPVRAEEVHKYCGHACSIHAVREYLEEQASAENIFTLKGYYSTKPEIKELVARREKGNVLAEEKVEQAIKIGRIIYHAPFVRFVGISGSLSKGYADDQSDFDFFIITAENRLWICRTLLHLFKKLTFLVGQQHKFCMNYFIDNSVLQLEEQNIYTATELVSMIPVRNLDQHKELLTANHWLHQLLPNFKRSSFEKNMQPDGRNYFKNLSEWTFNHLRPEALNRFLMKVTDKRWRKKWTKKNFPEADYPLAFKTTPHISKNHPANYQKKILEQLKVKITV